MKHVHDQLKGADRVSVATRHGRVTGARAENAAAVFLEIPYALPPRRFEDPVPLPLDFQYEDKQYVEEMSYAYQPLNDGQAQGTLFEDKVGFGKPTENPLFLNVYVPPSVPATGQAFPVKVYIHGGFLQFGSPHGLSSAHEYVAAERSEVWVNVGYRLSAFGFLASNNPPLPGNYGFKDQWLALEWVQKNIASFGGNPEDITLTGLSAGAHSVHQLLHMAANLLEGHSSPFQCAILQSNAMVLTPKTPAELQPQYESLCEALGVKPQNPSALRAVSAEKICRVIENMPDGTFRACSQPPYADLMGVQRDGIFERRLRARGVKRIIVGEMSEEWYLYSIAHPISTFDNVRLNLERYFPSDLVAKMLKNSKPDEATDLVKLFGELLSDFQVYLPVRLLARDMPSLVARYEIRWTPENIRPKGYVTHGTDRVFWAFLAPLLNEEDQRLARSWLDAIDGITFKLSKAADDVLVLDTDRSIGWQKDQKWEEKMRWTAILPGE